MENKTFNAEIHQKYESAVIMFRKAMLNRKPEVISYLQTLNQLIITDLESEEAKKLQAEIEVFETGISQGYDFKVDEEIAKNEKFIKAGQLARFKRGVNIPEQLKAAAKKIADQKAQEEEAAPVQEPAAEPLQAAAAAPKKRNTSKKALAAKAAANADETIANASIA